MSISPWLLAASVSFVSGADAGTWETLWWSPDQLGQRALDQGNYEQAAALFEDPYRKGWALYQLADYKSAEVYFRKLQTGEGYFYLANTLVMQEKYKEALKFYGKSIELSGSSDAVEKNLAVAKARLAAANKVNANARDVNDEGTAMLQVGVKGTVQNKPDTLIDPLVYSEEELNAWLAKVKSSPEKLLKAKFELQSQEKMIDAL